MNNLLANHERILEVLRKISTDRQLPMQRRCPSMSDLELISLSLTAEYMGIDSEKEQLYSSPCKGYCASQKMYYYGYKLHAVCSLKGVFQSIDLTPANVHDIHYLHDIKDQISDCTLLGDKGYLSQAIQLNLFEYANIRLDTPKRNNQKEYKHLFSLFRKSRKRIETLLSQMCDQFMIRRNYAKSFDGFKTRILTKITAMTVIQYINKNIFQRNINNLKISII